MVCHPEFHESVNPFRQNALEAAPQPGGERNYNLFPGFCTLAIDIRTLV